MIKETLKGKNAFRLPCPTSRKKTLLSLAKLHLVTEEKLGPDPELVQSESDAVESELTLLMHQEQLPAAVLHAYDLDPDTMRVLTACEMIEVFPEASARLQSIH